MYGIFCGVPDFTILGGYNFAHLDPDARAVVDEMHGAAARLLWKRADDDVKRLFSPRDHSPTDIADVASDVEDDGDRGITASDEIKSALEGLPPRFSMEQMQSLLYRESQGV